MHLPQLIRKCLDLDWHSKLIFAAESTSIVAFFHYDHSSPLLCHNLDSSCILVTKCV